MNKNIIIAGVAVFAMFFGAGNLVFPVMLGQASEGSWFSAILGFCLTGVLVPLIGLISVVLLEGSSDKFFACLGTIGSFIIQLVLMIIEGPFGIVPRTLTVAFGGIKSIFPNIPFTAFLFVGCFFLWFTTSKKDLIVPLIGKILTPIKIILILFLFSFGIYKSSTFSDTFIFSFNTFKKGVSTGYQTYDLPGAIYFAAIIMMYFHTLEGNYTRRKLLIHGLGASFISAFLLTTIYIAFGYLSFCYSDAIKNTNPEDMLLVLVNVSMGKVSTYIFGTIIVLACLTTAIAAISIWTNFMVKALSRWKISHQTILITSLIITFIVATQGFSGILAMMTPVLQIIYPILIVITVVNIILAIRKNKTIAALFLNKKSDKKFEF